MKAGHIANAMVTLIGSMLPIEKLEKNSNSLSFDLKSLYELMN